MMAASVSMHFLKPLVIVGQLLSYSRIAAAAPVQQHPKPPAEYTLHDFRDYAGRVVVSLSSSGSSKFSGSIESKSGESTVQDLAVKKDANVRGDLSARRISTSGLIEARSLELKGGLRAEGAVSAGALVADSNAKIQGELNVLGEASFSKGIKVQGVAALRGDLDVVGDVSAKRIIGDQLIIGKSIDMNPVSGKKPKIDARGGSIITDDLAAKNAISASSCACGEIKSTGTVAAKSIAASTDVKTATLNVRGKTDLAHLNVANSVEVNKTILAGGSITALSMISKGDLSAKNVLAHNVSANGHIKTSAGVSAATVASTTVSAKRIEVENLKVAGVITGDKLSSASVSTSSIEVNGILKATNSSIQHTLSIGKDVFVQETMQAKRISSIEDIRARGDIISDTKLVARDLEVTGTAEFSNATVLNAKITTLSTTENLFTDGEAHLGCVHASQVSVEIDGPVLNKANVTMEESLIVRDTIKAKRVATDVLSANRLSATSLNSTGNIFSNSTIRSSGGFFSQNGSVAVVNVSPAIAMVSSGLDTSNLNVRKDVSISGNVNFDEGLSSTNVTAESATFTGDVM